MTDIALSWDNDVFGADLAILAGDLVTDAGLRTAILISLFTDAAANDDDMLPAGADRRGWWGDALAETEGDVTGSRLWLLDRSKQLASVLADTRAFALEATQWLIDDQVASAIDAEATNPLPGVRQLSVSITRPDGRNSRFDYLWENPA